MAQLQSVISSVKRWQEEDLDSRPIGSDSESPPVTDEAGGGQLEDQHVQGQKAHQPKPAVISDEVVDLHNLPPHWRDDKHELDGTSFEHLDVPENVLRKEQLSPSDVVRGPIQFSIGANIGATTLVEQLEELEIKMLSSLTKDQWGKVTCYDDVSGDLIKSELVQAARDLEVDSLKRMRVYEVVPRSVVRESGKGKLINGRWLDVNKGDSTNPDVRSRYVGKEFATGVDATLYAGTPPLEALKLIMGSRRAIRDYISC